MTVKPTDPGERDQYITLVEKPTSKSSSGADIPAAEPILILGCWAKITEMPRGGRLEGIQAGVLATVTQYVVDIYYVPDITEQMDILWGTRTLDIIRVVDLGPITMSLTMIAEERR